VVIDTAADDRLREALQSGSTVRIEARSTLVLTEHVEAPTRPNLSAAASVAAITGQSADQPAPDTSPG
jgi:hypothetical protein